MNYTRDLSDLENVFVSTLSPRFPGETAARSEWVEIHEIPASYAERLALARHLAGQNGAVHVKTASGFGRARFFVRS